MISNLTLGKLIPLNLLSHATGALSRIKAPQPLNRWVCRSFVRLFRIDMTEADRSLDEYQSVEEIFTRALKPGARAIQGPVCSPSDGFLSQSGHSDDSLAIQAKGHKYSLGELIFGTKHHDELSHYITIYLAPHNYHRVHSPIAGRLLRMRYFPGELWPVNEPFVRFTPRLFVRNERLVFDIEDPKSKGRVYVAMVGALNVGRIASPFWANFHTNALGGSRKVEEKVFPQPIELKNGDEIGTFMLGSTVVLVFDRKAASYYKLLECRTKKPVRMGDRLTVRPKRSKNQT